MRAFGLPAQGLWQTLCVTTPAQRPDPADNRRLRREVLSLALPAFMALLAEPLFLLADSAIIGHLGTSALAGLAVASAILITVVNLAIFLAYGTTAVVSRKLGAGDVKGALSSGIDGLWLALILGVAAMLFLIFMAIPLVNLFGASSAVEHEAATYLRWSAVGLPGMLIVLAATGVLRGMQDTKTPMYVAIVGFGSNAILSVVLVHVVGWGIAGAAIGSAVAQTGMGIVLCVVVLRGALRLGASWSFDASGVWRSAIDGIPLLVRNIALRAAMLATIWMATSLGDEQLAAHQVATTVWSALAFALDALAIAAQALTGKALGAGDVAGTRSMMGLLLRWVVWFGVILGILIAALHQVIPLGFSRDADVQAALAATLLVVAIGCPIAGIAFILDGILIGAGDARWLAWAQGAATLIYLPMVYAVWASGVQGITGLVWLWIAFNGFMLARAAIMWGRARGDKWLVLGAG